MNVNKNAKGQDKDLNKARGQEKVILHEQMCGRGYK